mmetsp:Transcript_37218/g.51652  ORF Transcript_37218/g.51652 Transcript_37218/m.51652 type:complete len:140 (+) Transcript_37218:98-517(+)
MSAWQLIVFVMMPVPLSLCILVSAPLPRRASEKCCELVDSIVGFHLYGTPVVKVFIGFAFILFAIMSGEMYKPKHTISDPRDANQELNMRAKRWRNERNFWISTLVLALWMMLFVTYKLRKQVIALEKKTDIEVEKKSK